jgi:guanylate kinase
MILAIAGQSGVGKTTLIKNLRKMMPFGMLKSVTTREQRPTDLGEYEYVTDDFFAQLEKNGEFLWTAHPHGHAYGTRKADVNAALMSNDWYGAAIVTPSIKMLLSYAEEQKMHHRILPIFLELQDEKEMLRRLQERGENEITSRMAESRLWPDEAHDSDIPFEFVDTARGPLEIAEDVRALMREFLENRPVSRLVS